MKTGTRILELLALAYGLAVVLALFPGEAIGEAWARIGKPVPTSLSGENPAKFYGVLSALGAQRAEVVTYGGCVGDTRGSVFDETHLADYHLLPGFPIRAAAAPEPEAVPPAGVMVGYGLHPQAMSQEFREAFPFRMRCYNLRVASRMPLPEPGPVVERTGSDNGGEWKGIAGGVGVLTAMILPGLALGFLFPGLSGRSWAAAWTMGILVVTFTQWGFGNLFGIGFPIALFTFAVVSLVVIGFRFRKGWAVTANPGLPLPPVAIGTARTSGWRRILRVAPAILTTACLLVVALSSPMVSVAGLSNWGYKAKLLYLQGTWSDGWMDSYDGPNRQAAYPPGFPLLCANYYFGAGRVADWSVRALPPLLLGLTFHEVLKSIGKAGTSPVARVALALLGLACFLNPATVMMADSFYAEPMLGLFLAMAAGSLGTVDRAAESPWWFWMAMAGAAWVKPEGLVALGASVLVLPLWAWLGERDGPGAKRLLVQATIAGAFALGWYVWAYLDGLGGVFTGAWPTERAESVIREIGAVVVGNWKATGILVWMLPPMVFRFAWGFDWRVLVLIGMAAALVSGSILRMIFSTSEITSYVEALSRILWLPGLLCFLALLSTKSRIQPTTT